EASSFEGGAVGCATNNLVVYAPRAGATLGLVFSNRPETDVLVRATVSDSISEQFALRTFGRVFRESDGSCLARVGRTAITQWAWFADAGLSALGARPIIDAMPVAQPMVMSRRYAVHRSLDGPGWVEWQPQDDPAVRVELRVEHASVIGSRPTQPGYHEYELQGHHEPARA